MGCGPWEDVKRAVAPPATLCIALRAGRGLWAVGRRTDRPEKTDDR